MLAPTVPWATYAPVAETMHAVDQSDGAAVPMPPRLVDVGVPVEAQLFAVPFVPAVNEAVDADADSSTIAPMRISFA